jgi:hypothetical protein
MHISTPATLVRAIIEHTNQTFPFEDNHTTLFHRAATRLSLQEDKEVITCGISRCKLGFLVESRFWVMPYSFSCPGSPACCVDEARRAPRSLLEFGAFI